jgi:hypothetical protein
MGNRANGKRFELALEKAIAESSEGQDKWQALVTVAKKLVAEAQDGNIHAIKEIADRLDGKSSQQIAVTDKDGGPLQVIVKAYAINDT